MAEVQYPSNSNKSKEGIPPQKSINSSVSGDVQLTKSGKDKMVEAIFAKDIAGSLNTLFWTKALPRAKGAIMSNLHDALNAVFNWGGGNGNGQTNYNGMYNNSYPGQNVTYYGNNSNSNYQQITGHPRASDLTFSGPNPAIAEADAQNTLQYLRDAIEDCGFVTVNSLYGYLGKSVDSVWANYGWINVDNARIINQGNSYILKLPKASPINNV